MTHSPTQEAEGRDRPSKPFPVSWLPPATLLRTGHCLVPTELSWRRADQLVKAGFAAVDPHHRRWLGKLTLTALGRERVGLPTPAPTDAAAAHPFQSPTSPPASKER